MRAAINAASDFAASAVDCALSIPARNPALISACVVVFDSIDDCNELICPESCPSRKFVWSWGRIGMESSVMR